MQAQDIMTKKVITTTPDTLIDDVVKLMIDNHISAVPVVDADGGVVGLISEGDLMRRVEGASGPRRSWWLSMLAGPATPAQEFVALRGRHAHDIMTKNVLTVGPDMPIGDIAVLLEKHRIKRVPVVDDGKLVGIVSRANLLQGLASAPRVTTGANADDRALREAVIAALQTIPQFSPIHVNVTVQNGEAKIWGIANSTQEQDAVRVAAENVEGIKRVEVNLARVPAWGWGI